MREIDQIDLVDSHDNVPDAQKRSDKAVTARLCEHALTRINQHHCEIGGGSPRRHVAGILRMAGRISHDKLAARCREKAIGHINSDALLAFGFQAIDQQRKVEIVIRGAEFSAVVLQRRKLILKDQFCVIEKSPDQR
ncbi:hypothetical protein FQZ97_869960 [compost metagenome]